MTLPAQEFIRRFLQHVLPAKFHKVRYFGLLSPSYRNIWVSIQARLEKNAESGSDQPESEGDDGVSPKISPFRCSACKSGILILIAVIPRKRRRPP